MRNDFVFYLTDKRSHTNGNFIIGHVPHIGDNTTVIKVHKFIFAIEAQDKNCTSAPFQECVYKGHESWGRGLVSLSFPLD